ncbi:MAG: HipA domain-containing protein, partial [Acidobacteria bacterium]|nr:HipA domain-containing protein [Acidobacteriota bacterium]
LLTMRLAEMVGVDVPRCGLVRVFDRSLAFLVQRVGPHGSAGDLRQESLCQLAGKPAGEERDGSAELCAELVRRHSSEPLVALFKLYRLMVFAWWVGDGDVHLGNLALATGPDNVRELAPLRDLLCTRLLIPDDQLALPVGGKTDRLTRADWLRYGDACGLRPRIVERLLGTIVSSFEEALGLISRSFLSEASKVAYAELLGRRTAMLEARQH